MRVNIFYFVKFFHSRTFQVFSTDMLVSIEIANPVLFSHILPFFFSFSFILPFFFLSYYSFFTFIFLSYHPFFFLIYYYYFPFLFLSYYPTIPFFLPYIFRNPHKVIYSAATSLIWEIYGNNFLWPFSRRRLKCKARASYNNYSCIMFLLLPVTILMLCDIMVLTIW